MTIFGWDMSHYDDPGIGSAVSQGISFVTHKAGGDADDAELASWWNGVKGLRNQILVGAYWVLYPGSASSRADAFLARLDSQCAGWRDAPFILQVDCEIWGGDSSTKPSKSDIKTFCDRLVAKMPKLKPIVYGPNWVYGDELSGLGYPLWASSYVSGSGAFKSLYPGDSSSKWGAYSGQTPAILQYTSSATIGGQTTCDANAYRGTLAQLTALLAPGWEDTVDQADIDAIATAVVNKWRGYTFKNPYDGTNKTYANMIEYLGSRGQVQGVSDQVAAVATLVGQMAAKAGLDQQTVAAGVISGLSPQALGTAIESAAVTPETLAAAIPDDAAKQVAELLNTRLNNN